MAQISITPESIVSKMKLSPQQGPQLQRIVVAGMKVMFAPQTRHMLQQALQGSSPIGVKVGQGVAGLLGLLQQESQGSLPKNLLIPAGMVLCVHACEFLDQSGAQLGDKDVGVAIDAMQQAIMRVAKIDPDKLAAMTPEQARAAAQAGGKQQGAADPGAAPAGGLVNGSIGNTPSPGSTMSTAPGDVGHMGSGEVRL